MESEKLAELPVTPIQRRSVPEEIIHQLRILIESGHIKPGDKLPTERELSRKLNVSRPSLREAFKALSLLGIIQNRVGSGTYLTSHASKWPTESFNLIFILSKGTLIDIFEARKSLEGTCAALAAKRRSSEDIQVLDKALQGMKENIDNDTGYAEYEMEFHLAVIEASGNLVIADIMEKLYSLLKETRDRFFTIAHNNKIHRKKDFQNHKAIFHHINEFDAENASKAMVNHLLDFEKALLKEGD